ncbi:MAG: SpoIIE family protein phosphatase [Muribaculaceae bacterium]|nr:SpoIIE family protein phosphatase [Muribaculaceae bacterium]
MKKLLDKIKKLFNRRTWITLIIVFAALLIELFSWAQYYYTKQLLEEELEKKAAIEMTMKAILVKSMLNTTEQVLNSHVTEITKLTEDRDDIHDALRTIVEANDYFTGVGLAFEPGYYGGHDELYEPWAFNSKDGVKVKENIAMRGGHDYTNFKFYTEPMSTGKPYWSDPYIDSVETKSFITTYSVPIIDKSGQKAGIAGIDLSLEWLSDSLNNRHMYPSSFCMLLTDDGKLISQPSKNHSRYKDFDDAIRLINDSTANARTVAKSKIKVIEFDTEDGKEACVFFHHMKGNPHWMIAVVCYDDEVYAGLKAIRLRTGLLMLLGFMLLGYIIYRFLKNNKRMAQNEIERERLSSELQVAKRIQSEMLPHDDISHNNIDIAATLLAAREVGGDIYDYFLRDDKLFFCIGDASGKGVASALIMSVTHSMFRSFGSRESNPARIMQSINQAVCHGNDSSMFVTFFIGVLDLPTGRLHYCNAGHDTPVVIAGEPCKLDVKANMALGIVKDWFYERQETILKPGDTLLLYTDGLTEAMDAKHQQFGLQRVMETISSHPDEAPQRLLDTLTGTMSRFVGNAEQSDDLTMLAVRYSPAVKETVLKQGLAIENDLSHIAQVNDFVTEFCNHLNLDKSLATNMRLAIEEAVVNIINYAYPKGEKGDIGIVASATSDSIEWVITDNGVAFAPTDAPDVDTSLSAEDRQIGGLGIFLVRQLMDTINYERIDHKNVLTLTKKYQK